MSCGALMCNRTSLSNTLAYIFSSSTTCACQSALKCPSILLPFFSIFVDDSVSSTHHCPAGIATLHLCGASLNPCTTTITCSAVCLTTPCHPRGCLPLLPTKSPTIPVLLPSRITRTQRLYMVVAFLTIVSSRAFKAPMSPDRHSLPKNDDASLYSISCSAAPGFSTAQIWHCRGKTS